MSLSLLAWVCVLRKYPKAAAQAACDDLLKKTKVNLNSNASDCKKATLQAIFDQYKDPETASQLANVQRQVAMVKDVMEENIDIILANQESLDSLMEQSIELDKKSKLFLKGTKKMNKRCCVVM
jgi:synaptobrevin family protein YKT6